MIPHFVWFTFPLVIVKGAYEESECDDERPYPVAFFFLNACVQGDTIFLSKKITGILL
jgi:hypothetical protein